MKKMIKETMKINHFPNKKIIGWTLVLWFHCHSAAHDAVVVAAAAAAAAEAGVHVDSLKVEPLPCLRDEIASLSQS